MFRFGVGKGAIASGIGKHIKNDFNGDHLEFQKLARNLMLLCSNLMDDPEDFPIWALLQISSDGKDKNLEIIQSRSVTSTDKINKVYLPKLKNAWNTAQKIEILIGQYRNKDPEKEQRNTITLKMSFDKKEPNKIEITGDIYTYIPLSCSQCLKKIETFDRLIKKLNL